MHKNQAMPSLNSTAKSNNSHNPIHFQNIKRQFSQVIQTLEKQNKTNTLLFRDKYYELAQATIDMFIQINGSHQRLRQLTKTTAATVATSININKPTDQPEQSEGSVSMHTKISQIISDCDIINSGKQAHKQSVNFLNASKSAKIQKISQVYSEPLLMISHCKILMRQTQQYFSTVSTREQKLRKQMLEMFAMGSNYNFLQTLALKNLQTHKLVCKTDQMQLQIDQLAAHNQYLQQTVDQYTHKFHQMQTDYFQIVVSVADMLKKCQMNQIQLRQENRLQGELLQTHKIQFQRYKSNFKQKTGLPQKQAKMRKILHKQYSDKFDTTAKQIEKFLQQKYAKKLTHKFDTVKG